jgi:hypothetical protein
MSCMDEPGTDTFPLFIKAVSESCIETEYSQDRFHPLIRTVRLWGEAHGLVSVATWTKKILVGVLKDEPRDPFWESLGWDYDEGATLLACFGDAYRGDEVGLLGRDIVEPCLRHPDGVVFAAALGVLESWGEDDPDGTWRELLERHSDETFDDELDDEEVRQLEMRGCGFGDEIEELVPGLGDPLLEALEEKRARELEPFFETRRWPNSLRAQVRHLELPGFLARALQLHPEVTLGLLESREVGRPCVRQSTLEVHVERGTVRAWNSELGVSIEPTATSGTWLVFASWP